MDELRKKLKGLGEKERERLTDVFRRSAAPSPTAVSLGFTNVWNWN
jgi:hypothetical protein